MTPTLRAMRWQDIPELAHIDAELFADDAWPEPTWWAELAGRPRRDYLVASDGAGIAAYLGLDHGGEVTDVMTVAVAPRARGTGLGDVLLESAVTRAADRGAEAVILEVRADNEHALALYTRHGFVEIGRRSRYYQPGDIDALILRRLLTGSEG